MPSIQKSDLTNGLLIEDGRGGRLELSSDRLIAERNNAKGSDAERLDAVKAFILAAITSLTGESGGVSITLKPDGTLAGIEYVHEEATEATPAETAVAKLESLLTPEERVAVKTVVDAGTWVPKPIQVEAIPE